jgi:hypothetical protein
VDREVGEDSPEEHRDSESEFGGISNRGQPQNTEAWVMKVRYKWWQRMYGFCTYPPRPRSGVFPSASHGMAFAWQVAMVTLQWPRSFICTGRGIRDRTPCISVGPVTSGGWARSRWMYAGAMSSARAREQPCFAFGVRGRTNRTRSTCQIEMSRDGRQIAGQCGGWRTHRHSDVEPTGGVYRMGLSVLFTRCALYAVKRRWRTA